VDAAGNILISDAGPLQFSMAQLQASPTAVTDIGLNLDSREPIITTAFDINDPTTYNKATSMSVYDSLGNAHAFTTYYQKSAANTWEVYGALDGVPLTAKIGQLQFDTDGSLKAAVPPLPFSVSFALTNGATTPFDFTLDFNGATQFGSQFGVNTLKQDGYSSGQLSGFTIGGDGTVQGRYTNGQSRTLGQFLLVDFANPNGLQSLGNNAWGETATSGQPVPGGPGSGNLGVLQSGAVEESNVDLTAELVDMITAQRVYQANAQTIKTQDAVLNTLVNLR
jgi:flagellar hook protein FlgE